MPQRPPSTKAPKAPSKRLVTTLRKQLEREREELLSQASELEADFADESWKQPRSDDDAEAGSAVFERERLMSLAVNARRQVEQIDTALGRMDDGTFGTCTTCGQRIPNERLEARPQALDCMDCRRRAERSR